MKISILLLGLLTLAFLSLTEAKTLRPYCGPRTMAIRHCRFDAHCEYPDEYCRRG